MKPVVFTVTNQCAHRKPCPTPAGADAETRWKSSQTIEAIPPARWTLALLEKFVGDLCAAANITDPTLVEFRGGPDPGTVTVNGNGHVLTMSLTFIPDQVLGPWLLSQREHGNVWSAVSRPQPRDHHGAVRQPAGG